MNEVSRTSNEQLADDALAKGDAEAGELSYDKPHPRDYGGDILFSANGPRWSIPDANERGRYYLHLYQYWRWRAVSAHEPRARDADLYEWVSGLLETLNLAGITRAKGDEHIDTDYLAELHSRLSQPPASQPHHIACVTQVSGGLDGPCDCGAAPPPCYGLDHLRQTICAAGIVGIVDGHDVIRRDSVIDLIDRARASQTKAGEQP
jgi:hypothetical protein